MDNSHILILKLTTKLHVLAFNRQTEVIGDTYKRFIIRCWLVEFWRLRSPMNCCLQARYPEKLVVLFEDLRTGGPRM